MNKYSNLINLVTDLVIRYRPEKQSLIKEYETTLIQYENIILSMPIFTILDRMFAHLDIQKKEVDKQLLLNIVKELDKVCA